MSKWTNGQVRNHSRLLEERDPVIVIKRHKRMILVWFDDAKQVYIWNGTMYHSLANDDLDMIMKSTQFDCNLYNVLVTNVGISISAALTMSLS